MSYFICLYSSLCGGCKMFYVQILLFNNVLFIYMIDSTVTSMRKLIIAYNNGLRRMLNLPKYNSTSEMFVNLNIPSFDELLRKLVYSFRNRIQVSGNSLVNGIVKSSEPYLVRYGPGEVIFSKHNCYSYSCV